MTTVEAAGGSREARRRRIIERGADRLALITGRIQSLRPDPGQSRLSTSPPTQIPDDVFKHENVSFDSLQFPNLEETRDQHTVIESEEPSPENIEKCKKEERPRVRQEQFQLSSSMQMNQVDQTRSYKCNLLAPNQISSAITASENIRMYCSVSAAILVIFSYLIPGGSLIKSILSFKTLYLLFSTNLSIMLARPLLGRQDFWLRTGQATSVPLPTFGGNDMVGRVGIVLEFGLLTKKMVEAMFMDFGLYAVVLVCGFSFLGTLGW